MGKYNAKEGRTYRVCIRCMSPVTQQFHTTCITKPCNAGQAIYDDEGWYTHTEAVKEISKMESTRPKYHY